MSAKYKSPSFLLPNELNTSANPANDTGVNSLYSMDFNSSSSDYIDAGNPTELQITGALTISAWVKINLTSPTQVCIVSKDDVTNRSYDLWGRIASDGFPRFVIYNSNTGYSVSGTTDLKDNQWHHIVAVFTPNTSMKIYVDNVLEATNTTSIPSSIDNDPANFEIGRFGYGTYPMDGLIDEVAIFNRALESTEISSLWNNGSPSNLMATDLNPIAYYPLGEQAQMQGYLGNEASSEWQFPNGVLQDYVMDFDGTDNVNSEANISSVSSFTASIWINRDDSATQYIYGQWVDGTTASQSWVVQTVGGIVYFNVRDASLSVKSAISTTSLTTGVWYNIIAVWTGSNIKLYINNSLEDTTACSSMNNPSMAVKLAIGSSSNNVSPFNGKISNVVIWNSDQESNRDNIYNNGSPQTTYTVTPQNWWKLNADSVYTPSAPNYTTALDFDGSSNYIDLNFQSQTTPATISIWVNTDVNDSQQRYAIINGRADQQPTVYLRMQTDNTYQVFISNTNGSDTLQGSSATINTWFHFAIICENSQTLLYENGVLKDSSSIGWNGIDIDQSNNWQLGRDSRGQRYWNGKLSNAAVFNSALTPSQVSTLFNFGTPETSISFSPVAWWKLDNTTTGIQDSSGNGNNGTNNGATDISSGVAVTPSWKIPSALPITSTPNYTTALEYDSTGNGEYSLIPFSSNKTIDAISLWYNSSAAAGTRQFLINFTNSFSSFAYPGLSINESSYGDILFTQTWPTNYVRYDGGELSGWNNLVINYNTSTLKYDMYLNGLKLSTSTVGAGTDKVSTNGLLIGNRGGLYVPFKGFISNLCIFNSSLNETGSNSIETIYNSGTPLTSMSGFTSLDGWWTLKDTSTSAGGGLYDSSSNSNNSSANTASQGNSDVLTLQPVNGVSTTLPSTALQQSDLQFDSPYSNYSLSFDGTGGYIDCGDSDIFSFGNSTNDSPFSISAWIYMDSTTNFRILAKYDAPNYEYQFDVGGSSNLRFFIFDGTSYRARIGSTLSINQWYHVVATYNGVGNTNAENGIKIYVDGVEITGTTDSNGSYTAMHNTTAPVYIGRIASSYANGKIDEASMFDSVLTSSQVLEIYNNGKPGDITSLSPISWWRLGENAYFQDSTLVLPNSIIGAPNGEASTNNLEMISADAPGTYANGIGENLDILDRVGDAPLSTSNSQSYNMIPDDKVPYVPGYVGLQTNNIYSMSFDAASNTSFNATISALDNATALTFSGWFKKTINNVVGFESFVSSTDRIILYWWSDNNVYWSVRNGSASSTASSALTIYDWNHVVGTFDGATNTIKLYINGSLVDTETGQPSSTSANLSNNFHIGLSNGNTYNNGQIDEVAIWDKALTADQVKFDLYQPTATATNKTADLVNNPNLPTPVAWYRMGD